MAATSCHPPATLLGLPVELRLLVYEHIFQDLAEPLKSPYDCLPKTSRLSQVRDLGLVSRQIHSEASSLYETEWQSHTTLYFDNVSELYDTRQRGRPELHKMRFCLRIDGFRHGLDYLNLQLIEQQPGYVSPWTAPGGQDYYASTATKWGRLLAGLELLSPKWQRSAALPDPQEQDRCECDDADLRCPVARAISLPLGNGCYVTAHSHNPTDGEPFSFVDRGPGRKPTITLEGRLGDLYLDFDENLLGDVDYNVTGWEVAKSVLQHKKYWYCSRAGCESCLYADLDAANTTDAAEQDLDTWAAYIDLDDIVHSGDEKELSDEDDDSEMDEGD